MAAVWPYMGVSMCQVWTDRREAFDAWAAPHLQDMARLAARLSGAADAEDVVQDALVRAWTRWPTYSSARGNPKTWLLAIVADQARQRRRRPVPETSMLDGARSVAAGERTDGADLDLRRAVARLPERQRLAVECHYYIGLTVRETAQVMGCATGTVKASLSAARANLRAELEEP
jgi:RNA polymerase sigma factor (sigma-70 family)